MQRSIKFRAWIYREKVMVPVERLFMPKQSHSLIIGASNEERTIGVNHKDSDKDIEIMQYTGLKDKNGKEIYGGDICKMVISNEDTIKPLNALTVKIEMRYGAWGFIPTHPHLVHPDDVTWKSFIRENGESHWEEKYFTVIGSIYENPELLEVPK